MDAWTQEQLDMMIVGGNGNAREAFGETVLSMNDLKSKYTSKIAIAYKHKLEKKTIEQRRPQQQQQQVSEANLINFDQPQAQYSQSLLDFDEPTPVNKKEESFQDLDIFKPIQTQQKNGPSVFDDLVSFSNSKTTDVFNDLLPSQNTNKLKSSPLDDLLSTTNNNNYSPKNNHLLSPPSNNTNSSPLGNFLSPNHRQENDPFDDFVSSPNKDTPDKAVNDFFDQFDTPSTPASTKKRTLKPPKTAHSKLGARKVQSNVFKQQAELALREEKMRENGIDEETIGRNTRNEVLRNDQTVAIPKLEKPTSTRLAYQPQEKSVAKETERLGIMSLQSANSSSKKAAPVVEERDEDHYARDKFGNAKSISSDQYFGRNNYTASSNSARLSQFQGSQSISSDQYFGRPSTRSSGSTPMSKKILKAATKGAAKLQNMLAELDVRD